VVNEQFSFTHRVFKSFKDVGTPHMYLANLLSKSAENLPENIFEVADHEKKYIKILFLAVAFMLNL